MPADDVPEKVYAALKRSGFPFQTAVAHVLGHQTPWTLAATEMPWLDPAGREHFLDVVGVREAMVAAVECKKMEKATLTFLRPAALGNTMKVTDAFLPCTVKHFRASNLSTFYAQFRASPESYSSELCVVSTSDSGKDEKMIEPDVRLLLQATDALVKKRTEEIGSELAEGREIYPVTIYIPILVTSAPLYTTRYHPTDVRLGIGSFDANPEVEAIDWIRFTKSFSSDARYGRLRTVFVVRATALRTFLEQVNAGLRPELEDGRGQDHGTWKLG